MLQQTYDCIDYGPSVSYLVTMLLITFGTKTGTFLLLACRKSRILSVASASLKKSNSYPTYKVIHQQKRVRVMNSNC